MKVKKRIERLLFGLLSRPQFAGVNAFLLKVALRARGFNNFRTLSESGEAYFLEHILKPLAPTLCVDVGANVGEYSALLLEHTRADVVAFEPLPLCQAALKKIAATHGARLTLVAAAVGAEAGTADIHFEAGATAHASLSVDVKQVPYVANTQSVNVPVVTLDQHFAKEARRIDLLKIDTEGFEHEVLLGAAGLIARNPPKLIQIEFNWHQLFRKHSLHGLAQLLPGYLVFQLAPRAVVERDPQDPLSNIYLFSNYLFVRADVAAGLGGLTRLKFKG
jgi:FkbM family methyltransferase